MDLSYKSKGRKVSVAACHPATERAVIAEVSHELRLPIANLKLLIETLLESAGRDEEMRQHFLLKAQAEIERLQRLVVSLLQEQHAEHLGVELERQWNCLESKVKVALEIIKPAVEQKSLQVEFQIEPGWQIYANSQQLDQVLLNLLENAVKFTDHAGLIRINSGAGTGCFSVSDNGIGMAEPEIPKIFNRFYRIDRAQSRGSTGLGLSIVKHIIDLHGAKISVFSQEGKGSEFHLEFPGPSF